MFADQFSPSQRRVFTGPQVRSASSVKHAYEISLPHLKKYIYIFLNGVEKFYIYIYIISLNIWQSQDKRLYKRLDD